MSETPIAEQPIPQPDVSQHDQMKMALFNEARRCMNDNDRLLALSAQSDEYLQIIQDVANALGPYVTAVFPPLATITVDPEQDEPIVVRRLSDEEGAMLSEYVRSFVSAVNVEGGLADQLGLSRIEVQGPNGPFQYVPLVYDSATMRTAIFTALVMRYEQERNKRLIEVPQAALPLISPR